MGHVYPHKRRGAPRPRILGPNEKQAKMWHGFEQLVGPREGNGLHLSVIFFLMLLMLLLILLVFIV